ncbi:GNAT family N-acetyltransferase [Nocardia transvalensis]|uniref:GNAT family N-acetyltransferase n=1 Tax=Nocardia transvalensis TaxID=37333 RepID=UPI001893B359|nr:GNAT family N-acetyltransferase [Nocardia transvalensis]MBF6331129.1 GNAT family N-acetyltransferase [Nocardia transvalensis]
MSDRWPQRLAVRPWTARDARCVAAWQYDGPWSVYNLSAEEGLPDAADGYMAVVDADDGRMVGFYCTGAEARVPGLGEEPGVIDLGVGMDPAWVGNGHGVSFGAAVIDHVRRAHPTSALRVVMQSWNTRSLRLMRRLGFVESGHHLCVQDGSPVAYVVALLPTFEHAL